MIFLLRERESMNSQLELPKHAWDYYRRPIVRRYHVPTCLLNKLSTVRFHLSHKAMSAFRSRIALDTPAALNLKSLIVPRFHYSTNDQSPSRIALLQYLRDAQSCQIGVHLLLRGLRRRARERIHCDCGGRPGSRRRRSPVEQQRS